MRALILTALFSLGVLCRADSVTVTFTPDTLTGAPGDELEFSGTIMNDTGDEVFINADSFTFAIPGALDDSPFLNNAPISIDAGKTSDPFVMFDVTIPGGTPNAIYDGVFTIQGGVGNDNAGNSDNLGSGSFHVQVTPEPAALPFLGAGFAALVYARRRLRD